MSPRKPTIEDLDDEDGTVERDARRHSDLKLHVRRADEVALGGAAPPNQDRADEEGKQG